MSELTELRATPARLRRLAQLRYFDRHALRAGLRMTGALPDRRAWVQFLDYFLIALGALFLTSGIFFFVAYNWDELSRFARFGVVEGAIVGTVVVAQWAGLNRTGGKIALTMAALLVGALLAVFGQEYQTGADSYTLFANWALLILGWVLIAQFDLLWVGLLVLLNLALGFYWIQVYPGEEYPHLETIFALNTLALIMWEWMEGRFTWWNHRWPARLTALVPFAISVALTLWNIFAFFDDFDVPTIHRFGPLLYLAFLAGMLFVYTRPRPDLFMVTLAFFSMIVVITSIIGRAMVDVDETLTYFVTGAAIIVQAGVAVGVLRRVHLRWEEAAA